MSILYNWSGFESHFICLSGICDIDWLGSASEKSKARNDVPTNLLIAFGDNTKSYNVLCDTIVIVITTPPPIIYRIVYV